MLQPNDGEVTCLSCSMGTDLNREDKNCYHCGGTDLDKSKVPLSCDVENPSESLRPENIPPTGFKRALPKWYGSTSDIDDSKNNWPLCPGCVQKHVNDTVRYMYAAPIRIRNFSAYTRPPTYPNKHPCVMGVLEYSLDGVKWQKGKDCGCYYISGCKCTTNP